MLVAGATAHDGAGPHFHLDKLVSSFATAGIVWSDEEDPGYAQGPLSK
jgi:hypothetical protein